MALITLVSLVFLPETHKRDINDVVATAAADSRGADDLAASPAN
jgi:hypothetical protein